MVTPEHDQKTTHSYVVHYPAHEPRADDPHHIDFESWKRRRKETDTYYCDFAHEYRRDDTSECDLDHPLEAHHSNIELALLNEIDFDLLADDYPGINVDTVGTWIDGDQNLTLLCRNHHRGPMGVHTASFSDFRSTYYVRNLIRKV
jgi:hypothetical protein